MAGSSSIQIHHATPAEPCSFAFVPTFQQKFGSHTQLPVRPHTCMYTAFHSIVVGSSSPLGKAERDRCKAKR